MINGELWVVSTSGDAMSIDSNDVYLIKRTGEQLLEASNGSVGGKDFVVAASNATKAINLRYQGGLNGDVTDPGNYDTYVVVDSVEVASIVPGGVRVYGLDLAGDMDGDGLNEIVFSRGSTRGGTNAPALFIMEGELTVFTGIEDQATVPSSFELSQNYPNPFNPETKIPYSLPQKGLVTLKIYNVLGKEVGVVLNEVQTEGEHLVEFDGSALSSGIYFYKLEAAGLSEVKKMILMK